MNDVHMCVYCVCMNRNVMRLFFIPESHFRTDSLCKYRHTESKVFTEVGRDKKEGCVQ